VVAAVAVAVVVAAVVVKTGGAALALVAKVGKTKAAKAAKAFAKKHIKTKSTKQMGSNALVNAGNEGFQAWRSGECVRGVFVAVLGGAFSGAVSGMFGGKNVLSNGIIKSLSNMAGTVTNRLFTSSAREVAGLESEGRWHDNILNAFAFDVGFGFGFAGLDSWASSGGDLVGNLGENVVENFVEITFENILETAVKNEVKDMFK